MLDIIYTIFTTLIHGVTTLISIILQIPSYIAYLLSLFTLIPSYISVPLTIALLASCLIAIKRLIL